MKLLEEKDLEGYLHAQMMPAETRRAYVAIRAFNVETAAVKSVVGENEIAGRMRLQFWRDTVDDIFDESGGGASSREPVAEALREAAAESAFSAAHLHRMIDAREQDLGTRRQPASLKELERYCNDTQASLMFLYLELLGLGDEERAKANRVAINCGRAVGLAVTLRALPHLVATEYSGIPEDVARKHGVDINALLRGPESVEEAEAVASATFDVARLAHGYLEDAKSGCAELRLSTRSQLAFLPALSCAEYLVALQQKAFNAFDTSLFTVQSPFFVWRLYRAASSGALDSCSV